MGLEPEQYLANVVGRISSSASTRLHELLPWKQMEEDVYHG